MKTTARARRTAAKTAIPQCRSASWVAARLGGVSKVWIHRLHKEGRLRGYLLGRNNGKDRGGRLVFREEDVLAFLGAAGMPVEGVVDQS